MRIHDGKGRATLHETRRNLGMSRRVGGQLLSDEAGGCDVRLVAVLLKEHPLQYLAAAYAFTGNERRAFRQVPEDRVGFGEKAAVGKFKGRNLAVRIFGEEISGACCACED